jgi:hypothetical protein
VQEAARLPGKSSPPTLKEEKKERDGREREEEPRKPLLACLLACVCDSDESSARKGCQNISLVVHDDVDEVMLEKAL